VLQLIGAGDVWCDVVPASEARDDAIAAIEARPSPLVCHGCRLTAFEAQQAEDRPEVSSSRDGNRRQPERHDVESHVKGRLVTVGQARAGVATSSAAFAAT
jgi:hypothetical protein